jgi:hypothetical protein
VPEEDMLFPAHLRLDFFNSWFSQHCAAYYPGLYDNDFLPHTCRLPSTTIFFNRTAYEIKIKLPISHPAAPEKSNYLSFGKTAANLPLRVYPEESQAIFEKVEGQDSPLFRPIMDFKSGKVPRD